VRLNAAWMVASELLKVGDAARNSPTEHATHRADMWQQSQSQGAHYQRVLSVTIYIAQSPIAKHQVKNHQQSDTVKPCDRSLLEIGETPLEFHLDAHGFKKACKTTLPEKDKSR
jgi:hypothetical protein